MLAGTSGTRLFVFPVRFYESSTLTDTSRYYFLNSRWFFFLFREITFLLLSSDILHVVFCVWLSVLLAMNFAFLNYFLSFIFLVSCDIKHQTCTWRLKQRLYSFHITYLEAVYIILIACATGMAKGFSFAVQNKLVIVTTSASCFVSRWLTIGEWLAPWQLFTLELKPTINRFNYWLLKKWVQICIRSTYCLTIKWSGCGINTSTCTTL